MSVKPIDPQTQVPATRPKSLKEWLDEPKFKAQVAASLPKHLTAERYLSVARATINGSPKLQECTVESVLDCILRVSQLGIELDGRRAHLIPYGKKCTLVVDYKGIAELVRRSGTVKAIHIDVVCENDFFEFQHGTDKHLIHRPVLKNRGKIVCAYSFVNLTGDDEFDVMDLDDILMIMENSKGYQYAIAEKKDHPWISSFPEMAKKTVFRRHSKILPLSPEIRSSLEIDDDAIDVESTVTSVSNAPKFLGRPEPKNEPTPVDPPTPSDEPKNEPPPQTQEPAPVTKPADPVPITAPTPVNPPPTDGKSEEAIKLEGLMASGKVTQEEIETYCRNSNPQLLKGNQTWENMTNAKISLITKMWPAVYAAIKGEGK